MKRDDLKAVTGAVLALSALGAAASDGTGVWIDPAGDAVIRRTDTGNDGPLPAGFEPIDLLEVRVRGWQANNPASDPYTGFEVSGDAHLFRLDITFAGVAAPPGPLGLGGEPYDPHRFGDRPVFGYIELDIDDQKNSGGELWGLAINRYLANVGRFGLSPQGSISERIVRNSDDVDQQFFTLPEFERTGGDFAFALCGCFAPVIVSQNGDQDGQFEAGETWIVSGRFFERFQAFAGWSDMFNGSNPGLWDPELEVRFSHDAGTDETTVTLVYGISNVGSAQLAGTAPMSHDFRVDNQTSIEEALEDLIERADDADGEIGELSDPWRGRDYTDYRRPRDWGASALIGSAYTTPQSGALFVWTDTGFNETFGDLDDDDLLGQTDVALIEGVIDTDADGRFAIDNFGPRFDIRDLDGNGEINLEDRWQIACPADLAAPFGALNFFDISAYITLYNQQSQLADFLDDEQFNFFDIAAMISHYNMGCP